MSIHQVLELLKVDLRLWSRFRMRFRFRFKFRKPKTYKLGLRV